MLILCTDFQPYMLPETIEKVCGGGGGGWWVVKRKFSVLLWSKPLTLELKIWTWTKPNKSVRDLLAIYYRLSSTNTSALPLHLQGL